MQLCIRSTSPSQVAKHGLSGGSLASRGSLSDQGSQDQRQGRIFIWNTTITSIRHLKNILLQVVYFTSLFPYCVLLVLAVRGSASFCLLSWYLEMAKVWPKLKYLIVYLSIEFKHLFFHLKFCCPIESNHQGWLSQAPSKAYLTTSGTLRNHWVSYVCKVYPWTMISLTKSICKSTSTSFLFHWILQPSA